MQFKHLHFIFFYKNILFDLKIKNIIYLFLIYIILITKKAASENFFKFLNFFINYQLTSWKQYLKEKFRTKKEKLAWAKTWAWKHESKLSTMKGFYIPPQLPQTDQAKFFLKKRDEDEQILWDKELLLLEEANQDKIQNLPVDYLEPISENLKKQYTKLSFTLKWDDSQFFNVKHFNFIPVPRTKIRKKNSELSNFFFWFTKNFLKTPFLSIKLWERQHLWSFLNLGYNTSDFLNFFYIHYFPFFLVNFNFLKNKILLTKRFWKIYQLQPPILSMSLQDNLMLKNNYFSTLQLYCKDTSLSILNKKTFRKLFSFVSIFKNWYEIYQFSTFFKNFILNYLNYTDSLLAKLIKYFFNLIKKYFIFEKDIKEDLLVILFSWLFGSINYNIIKTKNWKRKNYLTFFNYDISTATDKLFFKNYLDFFDNFNFINFSSFDPLFFLDFFFTKFDSFVFQKIQLNRTTFQIFFEKITQHGNSSINNSFFGSKKLSKTFFVFLWNWVKHYENLRFLFHASVTQNLKVIDEFNVARILFRYIIRKGEKFTARRVFLKFLKKFKKNYALPPLMIFAHALLFVEPKIWLKEKKIAGKVYQIPIYISPKRSKSIAIWWLLQAAKKRQTASITESLAQEVWDACFKRGQAYNNKEALLVTAKKNKAYLRWF